MGLLRLAVFGTPEVFHEGKREAFSLRKAQALLFYLAVEGGMHPRSKLAAFLWPDSEPNDARTSLRHVLVSLRNCLAHPDGSPSQHVHLFSQRDLIGLDLPSRILLDLDEVRLAYQQARMFPSVPQEEQSTTLVAQLQQALSLVRGPFLDGFWLGEDAPFDEWREQQHYQWQVRLHLLFDRLSSWYEATGESEQAKAILIRWLAFDPLHEEGYRRLMRTHLSQGDPSASLQVYASCRARLAEELQVKPSSETVALAERARSMMARRPDRSSPHPATITPSSAPLNDLISPMIGRSSAMSQIIGRYQLARQGHPQIVLIEGEAGIGKTRLATEFVAWLRAQEAEVLMGQTIETGGQLPYQPLVEAIRSRLEEEHAPEDLLEDLWLAELSRLLPELRVRYPDLPVPPRDEDELATRLCLFEAVARLFDALAQRAPLVLLLDDLHWCDEASADLLRYLVRHWREHRCAMFLLCTVRSEMLEMNPQLSARLVDLRRDLPYTQVILRALSQTETTQLIETIVDDVMSPSPAESETSPASPRPLVGLAHFLFAQTRGQPLYLIETLKLMQDRWWLVPKRAADGTWKFMLAAELAEILAREQIRSELVPSSVRAMILLDSWLDEVETNGVAELRSFAQGLRKEYQAVKAGLTETWSNGPTEAQIQRLKLLKRQMYGQAGFPLLRQRVLHREEKLKTQPRKKKKEQTMAV